jgi:hypothetical protein
VEVRIGGADSEWEWIGGQTKIQVIDASRLMACEVHRLSRALLRISDTLSYLQTPDIDEQRLLDVADVAYGEARKALAGQEVKE